MRITPESATIFTTIVAVLLAADGLGSGGTIAVTYGGATVCGIVAGEPTLRIKCYQNGRAINVQPNVSFESVSGGRSFFCGLRHGGAAVLCWDTASFQPKRIYFNRTGPLTGLTVGEDHVCAARVDSGKPICWRGAAPDGSPFPSPENSPDFRTITSGIGFSCGVVKSSYKVVCWGITGNLIGAEIETRFENFSMSSLIAGEYHACGLTTAGDLVCGGLNDSGQSNPPSGSSGSTNHEYSGLALGAKFSCGIEQSSGLVTCWGSKGTTFTDSVKNISFESIVAGSDFACGLVSANLSVICFGPGFENSLNSTVGALLGTILPGPCVQGSCGPCPTFPDSETLCGGSGNICRSCRIELPVAIPISPPNYPATSRQKKSRNKLYLSSIVVGSIGAFLGLCSVLYCFCRAHTEKSTVAGPGDGVLTGETPIGAPPSRSSSCAAEKTRKFSFAELAAATGDFSQENQIGSGSFGHVYRGTLAGGEEVAVKRGDPAGSNTNTTESAFESELALLSRVHHKHLVGLIGFCHVSGERLLVYEYMANGSLHDHLHRQNDAVGSRVIKINSWKTRISILLGAARGLEYLHSYAVPPIIHRDIKSSNILLDSNWAAKVSDFGLSLMGPNSAHEPTTAVGTLGYIDPEYYASHVLTTASDVYGLGVVLFEALTGKRAVFVDDGGPATLAEHAAPWAAAGMVGRVLDGRVAPPETAAVAAAVEVVAATALRCVELEGNDRPAVGEVVASLERAVALCEGRESSFSATSSSFISSY